MVSRPHQLVYTLAYLKFFLAYSKCSMATVESPEHQLRRKDLEWKWENQEEERHLIVVTQVIRKQEKQKKDDDIKMSKAGIMDKNREEMMIMGEMRNRTQW